MPIQNQFGFQMSSIPQTSFWFWTFLAVSYCKTTQMLQYAMHFYLYTNHERKKIAFSSVITDFKFIYFLVNIFPFFPHTFPFPIYLWLYCTKSKTAGLFSTIVTALLCSLLMSHPILKVRKSQKNFFLVLSKKASKNFLISA